MSRGWAGKGKRVQGVCAGETLTCQGEVGAEGAVEAGEEEAAADLWEEADGRLGHGEGGALRGYPKGRVQAETDAAAHCEAVHEGDVWLGVCGDEVVELVFEAEVIRRPALALGAFLVPLCQDGDITAGTQCLFARSLHDDDVGHV